MSKRQYNKFLHMSPPINNNWQVNKVTMKERGDEVINRA